MRKMMLYMPSCCKGWHGDVGDVNVDRRMRIPVKPVARYANVIQYSSSEIGRFYWEYTRNFPSLEA
jgi:hypothetical protein